MELFINQNDYEVNFLINNEQIINKNTLILACFFLQFYFCGREEPLQYPTVESLCGKKKMILEPETIYFNAMWVKISLVPVTLTLTESSGLIDLFASRIKHYY